jgi:hypothetical protein
MFPVGDMVRSFMGKHAMVSFAAPWQIEVCAEVCQSVVLDNGAFSAWKANADYDFTGYARWAAEWVRHPAVEWCVIPDVIDGDEKQNDELMEAWELPASMSVPVWHMHESLERLKRLAAYPRVAIGSSQQYAEVGTPDWWVRMSAAMDSVCDEQGRPMTKLHGLRMLDPGVFSKIPLASADSTSVARNVGLDDRWKGRYVPQSRTIRALILMERVERHASASRWNRSVIGAYQNMDLFG